MQVWCLAGCPPAPAAGSKMIRNGFPGFSEFRVYGLGIRDWGLGIRVEGLGRVENRMEENMEHEMDSGIVYI